MNACDAIAHKLKVAGVDRVWTQAGGTISRLLDAIDRMEIRIIVARNEAGAGHMAQAAYRITGQPQVVLVTSGPGATNVLTAVADAYFDSDAVVFLVGQVVTRWKRPSARLRQLGFQEVDLDIFKPVAKSVRKGQTAQETVSNIAVALQEAGAGRPGPIVVECPMDFQVAEVDAGAVEVFLPERVAAVTPEAVAVGLEALLAVIPFVVLCGRGTLGHGTLLERFSFALEAAGLFVESLPARGAVEQRGVPYFGMVGHCGHPRANQVLYDARGVLALGSRMDLRQVGTEVLDKVIVRVDLDPAELQYGHVSGTYNYCCSIDAWLKAAIEYLRGRDVDA